MRNYNYSNIMSDYTDLKRSILNYISNGPFLYEHPLDYFANKTEKELLRLVDGTIDTELSSDRKHTYEIIQIDSFSATKQYEHYAPTWCIFQSEAVFYEETHHGTCHFIFCKRDDADNYGKIAFGYDYPHDNYGLSFFAVLLTRENRVVSVTSRRNWDEDFDHYLGKEQLKHALGDDLYYKTINDMPLKILQISDTHNKHQLLTNLPAADVIVHCGDFTYNGTEEEVLDFLNWFIDLPYPHKVFIAGNHDLCLWDADYIEDLPENVHFLQDRGCEICGLKFFGLAYNHSERRIPHDVDILVTHEPPAMILDESMGTHWGNIQLRNRVFLIKPKYHLFGHVHGAYGTEIHDGIVFSNGANLDSACEMCHKPKIFAV